MVGLETKEAAEPAQSRAGLADRRVPDLCCSGSAQGLSAEGSIKAQVKALAHPLRPNRVWKSGFSLSSNRCS
jgi:hypothetical protein